jgi:hypothetical protein
MPWHSPLRRSRPSLCCGVSFAIDPNEPNFLSIFDLDLAPRNADGLVEFFGTLDMVEPVDPARGSRRIL